MRNLSVDFSEYEGCCAVDILHDFPSYEGWDDDTGDNIPCKKRLSDEEWFNLFDVSIGQVRPLYTFANSSGANEGACTPTKFARWLRSQGEAVYTGANAINPVTRNTITVYTWAPSKSFKKKLENYKNKKNKKDAEFRGARAA